MFVRDRMSRNPITVSPETSFHDALRIMREEKIRRLPVLDRKGKLVGIVLERDLLYASPSPATSLSVYELNYLVAKITIGELMTKSVITVDDDCPLEEAARIMVDNHISGLPVMRGEALVGMITESDLFRVFLEMLGAREGGLRVSIKVPDQRGFLARLSGRIAERGGNIVSLGTFSGDDPTNRRLTIKIQDLSRGKMEEALEGLGAELLDIRETP
ncbi:MAG: CBS domain-containing protein [Chloroflexi bacterium]|nr:CBS domain-containing protein [Chloroflexota bacterium]